ncbi:MAG: ATP-dependent helicase, partial [Mycobacterium sp.]|nr:ATP-dependent helicase [Mycobacterium sp.]
MLVLHGFWSASNGLCLWAEDSTLTVTSSSDALRSARPHPFVAPADAIAAIHAGKPAAAVLLLPSLRKSPLDSPELFRVTPRPAPRSEPVLLPWTVPVMSLPASSAVAALDELAADVRYGASVVYLAELAGFARELVQRGRVLPALSCDEHGPVAFWRPILQGADIMALNSLIAAMPPVCRAEPEAQDGHQLATSALYAFADAAVRTTLPTGIELLPPRRGRRPKHVPAQERWLTALTAPDGRFDADPGELDALAGALRPWDAIGADEPGPARAMFRLTESEEPDGQQPGWRLEFLLQSIADPSLLVPAEQTWDEDGSLRRWLERPQELLLAELGRAVRIYPELAPALRTARPSEISLDT